MSRPSGIGPTADFRTIRLAVASSAMTEIHGHGNVEAGGPVQGTSISGRSRLVVGGRVYSSQQGARYTPGSSQASEPEITTPETETTVLGQRVEHTIEIFETEPVEGDVRMYESHRRQARLGRCR